MHFENLEYFILLFVNILRVIIKLCIVLLQKILNLSNHKIIYKNIVTILRTIGENNYIYYNIYCDKKKKSFNPLKESVQK